MINSASMYEMSNRDLRWIFGILFSVIIVISGIAFCIVKLAIFFLSSYVTIKLGYLLSFLAVCCFSFLRFSEKQDSVSS
jgi:hypothetical protein